MEESFTSDEEDEYYSDDERDEQGQVRLVSAELLRSRLDLPWCLTDGSMWLEGF